MCALFNPDVKLQVSEALTAFMNLERGTPVSLSQVVDAVWTYVMCKNLAVDKTALTFYYNDYLRSLLHKKPDNGTQANFANLVHGVYHHFMIPTEREFWQGRTWQAG